MAHTHFSPIEGVQGQIIIDTDSDCLLISLVKSRDGRRHQPLPAYQY